MVLALISWIKKPKIIQKICDAGINEFLKANKSISQKAMELAKQKMRELKKLLVYKFS